LARFDPNNPIILHCSSADRWMKFPEPYSSASTSPYPPAAAPTTLPPDALPSPPPLPPSPHCRPPPLRSSDPSPPPTGAPTVDAANHTFAASLPLPCLPRGARSRSMPATPAQLPPSRSPRPDPLCAAAPCIQA
jgi:hypothetical protein